MKANILIFIIGFIIAFTGGYLFFGGSGDDDSPSTADNTPEVSEESTEAEENAETEDDTEAVEESSEEEEGGQTASTDAQQLSNCLSCHAVDSLGINGGNTGPDLSNAFAEVEGKHGKDLDSFLQEPTSAVMATVIADNPLSDEERDSIVEVLKRAAEETE